MLASNDANPVGAYVVAQLGARMHYAIPRILHEAGRLERLFTDFAALPNGFGILNCWPRLLRPAAIRRLLGRAPEGIPSEYTAAFPDIGINYALRLRFAPDEQAREKAHLWAGHAFGNRVVACGFGSASSVYCFNTAGLEILTAARRLGLRTVLEQTIAPKRVERRLLLHEDQVFPGWEPDLASDSAAAAMIEREEEEWRAADLIICASEFVRSGIGDCGGPMDKCVVVPYGVSTGNVALKKVNRPQGQRLKVLMVGTVGLRKGVGYLARAAEQLRTKAEIRVVGPIAVSQRAQSELRARLNLMGAVPRSDIQEHFHWADVFVLPSLCEGSATVVYEALSHGLPVVCTPNTGSVVRDGVDGFLVAPGSADALTSALGRLHEDQKMLFKMSENALSRAKEFTLEKYAERLLKTLRRSHSALSPHSNC